MALEVILISYCLLPNIRNKIIFRIISFPSLSIVRCSRSYRTRRRVEHPHRSPVSHRRRRKGKAVPGGCNWVTLFPVDIHGELALQVEGSRIWDHRMTTLARPDPPSRQGGWNIRTITAGIQLEKKSLVVCVKGPDAKTKCLAVNHPS
jgi:hypothetical protein